MSHRDVLLGLHERFLTVPGLKIVARGEPTSIQAAPALFSTFVSVTYAQAGQVQTTTYRDAHSLFVLWQDNAQAEMALDTYIDALAAAVEGDPRLGGRIPNGMAVVSNAQASFTTVGGVQYRVIDFFTDVIYKRPIARQP